MHWKTLMLASGILLCSTSSWAIYRCEDSAGKLTFQDAPCTDKSRQLVMPLHPAPAPVHAPSTHTAAPAAQASTSEAQRLNTEADRLRKSNRLADINNLHLSSAGSAIQRLQTQCRAEMDSLAQKKSGATGDLAAAMAAQSVSTEMQAVATRCASEQQTAQLEFDRLRSEKAQLERELGL